MFIEEIRDTQKCVGCSNCKNACPVQAIDMIEDKEGFLVPNINHDKCVNCAKCEKVCPNHQLKYRDVESLPEVRLVRAKNEDLLKETASGGICTVLSNYFIREKNGYVCGALYNDDFRVVHALTNSLTDIDRMRQSKYVQSDLGSCFSDIEAKLKSGVYVLFIGTGCQVYALKNSAERRILIKNAFFNENLIQKSYPQLLDFQTFYPHLRGINIPIQNFVDIFLFFIFPLTTSFAILNSDVRYAMHITL